MATAIGGERPKQSDIDKGIYKNYEEYRQAVLAWKKKQPDPNNPRIGDKKTIPRRRVGKKWTKAYTVIWNGKKWVKKGDSSLVPNRAYNPDLNSKEYKLAKETNERVSKKNNNNNNNKKVVPKEENNKKVVNKEEQDKPTYKPRADAKVIKDKQNKNKLKIKTPKGFIRNKGRLYSAKSAQGKKLANRLKAKNRAKEMAKKRKEQQSK